MCLEKPLSPKPALPCNFRVLYGDLRVQGYDWVDALGPRTVGSSACARLAKDQVSTCQSVRIF